MGLIRDILEHPVLIEYMSGANNYTWLYFQDGRELLISKPLRYFEKQLPDFIRVHKTALVNPQYIQELQVPPRRRMAGAVRMSSEVVLPVGRRRWIDLEKNSPVNKVEPIEMSIRKSRRPVFYLTEDEAKALLFRQTVEDQYPNYIVHCLDQDMRLPELLNGLPDSELPALILLDARTAGSSQIRRLNLLKSDPRTALIPTLLLVNSTAREEVDYGYAEKANSVVMVPEQNNAFVSTINRLTHYWLTVMELPPVIV